MSASNATVWGRLAVYSIFQILFKKIICSFWPVIEGSIIISLPYNTKKHEMLLDANNIGIFSYPVKAESCARCCLSVVPSFFQMWTKHSRPGQRGDILDVITLWCWSGSRCGSRIIFLLFMYIIIISTLFNSFSFSLSAQNYTFSTSLSHHYHWTAFSYLDCMPFGLLMLIGCFIFISLFF